MQKKNEKNVILMVLNQNFPDVRVCQEIDTLTMKGYEVYVLVSSISNSSSPEYKSKDYKAIVVDLKTSKLQALISLFRFYNNKVYKRIIKDNQVSDLRDRVVAVHVHDLLWGNLGYRLSKHFNSKFIIDYHENYPALDEFLGSKLNTSLKGKLIKWLKSRKRLINYEEKISNLADKIIVVVDENKSRLIRDYNLCESKFAVVSNTKDINKYIFYGLSNNPNKINIFYHGSIQKMRGLRTLINAFKNANNDSLTLTIIGFKQNCTEKNYILGLYNYTLPDSINLYDWSTNREFMLEEIKKSDLCVIPHEKSELSNTTIPNKIFEYMCHGKPLLVSDVSPLKRIVSECNCGYVFEAGNIEELTSILSSLKNKEELTFFSMQSREMAEIKYDWSNDANNLSELYSNLI